MKINEEAIPVLIQQLEQAYQTGQRWFSYPIEETLDKQSSLGFYPNFKTAGQACYEAVDQDKYLLAKDIPSALRELRGIPLPEADTALVRKALEQDRVIALDEPVQLVNSLARGELQPVNYQQTIDPAQAIDQFLVIGHQFPRGMIYETGHEISRSAPFVHYPEAYNAFQQLTHQTVPSQARLPADYLLVGIFKNQSPELTIEGEPANHTGLVLQRALPIQKAPGEPYGYEIHQKQSIYEPAVIQQSLFTRYNEKSGRLDFYDGALDLADPRSLRKGIGLDEYYFYIDREPLKSTIPSSIKTSIMNEKNYDYLTEQLKYTGFGDKLNDDLRKQLEKQQPEFKLSTQDSFGKDTTTATLHFKKSDQSDMVFFNKYDLQLKKENNDNSLQQTFYVNKGNTITLKEGYNLLDGRAVHKTLTNKQDEKYNAWLQLDFKTPTQSGNYEIKQYHQNYGFDLEKELAKYPIQELSNERYKESLLKSLEKGNLQSATFLANGEEKKLFLTPNIAFKTLQAFDSDHRRVMLQPFTQQQEPTVNSEQKPVPSEKQSATKEQQQKLENDTPEQKKVHRQKIKH